MENNTQETQIQDSEPQTNAWQISEEELRDIEKQRQEHQVGEYMNRLVENDLQPFFEEMFPTIFNEELTVKVNFRQSDDVKISADKVGDDIRFEAPIRIDGQGDIANQPATFKETLGDGTEGLLTREIVDKIILVHELAHKYCDDYMAKHNKSRAFLQEAATAMNTASDSKMIPGIENSQVAVDVDKLFSSGELENYGISSDSGEALAKSVEKIYIEKMFADGKLTKGQYDSLIDFEQSKRSGQSQLPATNNPESENNRSYDDQVFARLYKQVGEPGLVEFLENVDFFGEYKIARIDPETGQYTEGYKDLIDNPIKILNVIKDGGGGAPIENLIRLLSSDAAKRAGVDIEKYKNR